MKVISEQTLKNKDKKVESMLLIDGVLVGVFAGGIGVIYAIDRLQRKGDRSICAKNT